MMNDHDSAFMCVIFVRCVELKQVRRGVGRAHTVSDVSD